MWGTDKELHRYPKGFRQKLAKHYSLDKPRCVICWSQNKVAIHHYMNFIDKDLPMGERYSYAWQYRDKREKPDWSDLSKFVLLCGSCHSKIHSIHNFGGRDSPFSKLLNDIVNKYKVTKK